MSVLSFNEEAAITFIPLFPGLLSLLGSGVLLRLMLRAGCRLPYRRILSVMSVFDIINTITICLGPFLYPSATSGRRWAVGNDATCSAVGFIIQVCFGPSFVYYGILSVYYVFRIRWGMSDTVFGRKIEPWLHGITIGFFFISAIVLLSLGMFSVTGPYAFGCWIMPNTDIGCDAACTRRWSLLFSTGPLFVVVLIVLVRNIFIYRHVRTTYHISIRHSMNHDHSSSSSDNRELSNGARKTWAVASQALLYVGVFVLTYFSYFILTVIVMAGEGKTWLYEINVVYPLVILRSIFLPSMGFGNCLVYVWPRYRDCRRKYPLQTCGWALWLVLWKDGQAQEQQGSSTLSFRARDAEEAMGLRTSSLPNIISKNDFPNHNDSSNRIVNDLERKPSADVGLLLNDEKAIH